MPKITLSRRKRTYGSSLISAGSRRSRRTRTATDFGAALFARANSAARSSFRARLQDEVSTGRDPASRLARRAAGGLFDVLTGQDSLANVGATLLGDITGLLVSSLAGRGPVSGGGWGGSGLGGIFGSFFNSSRWL